MMKSWKTKTQMSESMALAVFLTLAGGFQDAYSYNCRGKVFANAQTGNLVLLGQDVYKRQPQKNMRSAGRMSGLRKAPRYSRPLISTDQPSSALKPRSARGHLSEATPWWAPTVWWACLLYTSEILARNFAGLADVCNRGFGAAFSG